jgi:ABC-type dipeptide/oligopeptide/nickel transport system permease component
VMLGALLLVSACVVAGNLLADVAYAAVDPRIRLAAHR